jgi:hypothetical protein
MIVLLCNPSTQNGEAGGPRVQGQPLLHNGFMASLSNKRLCSFQNKAKPINQKSQSTSLQRCPSFTPSLNLTGSLPLDLPFTRLVRRSPLCCLPLQVDAWRSGWSVPCLALPLMPFDSGHKEDVRKGKARYGGGHPKGHCVGSLIDFFPVSAPSDLQCSPQAQPEHLAKAARCFSRVSSLSTNFVFDSSAWPRTHMYSRTREICLLLPPKCWD